MFAITKAIEEAMGNRQGQRTDKELPQNFGEVPRGKETSKIAARKAGFKNQETSQPGTHDPMLINHVRGRILMMDEISLNLVL